MKSISAFFVAIFLALALAAASVAGLGYVCTSADSGQPRASRVPVNLIEPDIDQIRRAVFVHESAEPAQVQFMQHVAMSPDASSDWWRRFLCDLRASDIALAGFALFLVIASVFQGFWMWGAMRATEKSARIVDAAMISTQRAYVVFKEFKVHVSKLSPIEDIQSCAVQPVWENAGTTPTRNGRTHVNWRYFERAIPSDFELADFDDMGNRILAYESHMPLVIGPKATSFSPVITFDSSTIRMVREGQGRVLIWGWAEYDDVFNETSRHRTEFAYQLTVTGGIGNSHVDFSQYRRFNGVDEDCERKPTLLTRH